jgi:hypothetical protein
MKALLINNLMRKEKIIVFVFFILFGMLGLNIYKDYGVANDEIASRDNGIVSLKYAVLGNQQLLTYKDRDYGPAFEMFLVILEVCLGLTGNLRQIILFRHLMVFLLFFTAVICFYNLCKYRFKSRWIALIGCLFLIISPRIFTDSFVNTKDSVCLSLFVINIFTLFWLAEKKTFSRAAVHALVTALLIDVRLIGLLVPALTVIYLGLDSAERLFNHQKMKKTGLILLFYLFITGSMVILFWPFLWNNPLGNFLLAWKNMIRFVRWGKHTSVYNTVLYMGQYWKSLQIPWHYLPVWIAITTPLSYILFFISGCLFFVRSLFVNRVQFFERERRIDLICLLWFFLPLTAVIVFKSVVYDAWRQFFFIYPAFLLIALGGLVQLFKVNRCQPDKLRPRLINTAFILFLAFDLLNVSRFMVKSHPFQSFYFNILAGNDFQRIKENFELDYYGQSYRKALEYILSHDRREAIKVYANQPVSLIFNSWVIPGQEKKRLVFVEEEARADYFISNYRWHKEEYPYKNEFYSIKIEGVKILVVYRI